LDITKKDEFKYYAQQHFVISSYMPDAGVFLEVNRGFQRGIDLPCLEGFAPVKALTIYFSRIGNKSETVDVTPVCL